MFKTVNANKAEPSKCMGWLACSRSHFQEDLVRAGGRDDTS